jgi:uncharacterized membrane protein YdbT with pleckstrin-like domain
VPFPRKLLNAGETIVLDLRPHWWFMSEPTASLLGSVILGLLVRFATNGEHWWRAGLEIASAALIVFCLVWFAIRYVRWTTTNFVVTSDRVVYRHGALSKHGIEIPLDKINTVLFNQTVFERILGAGDLSIESASTEGMEKFHDVRKPSIVQNEIYKQMEGNENRKMDRVGTAAHGPTPTTAPTTEHQLSIPEQLEKLDELRRRGVISEAEFAAKKTELLGRL